MNFGFPQRLFLKSSDTWGISRMEVIEEIIDKIVDLDV
jgi:hypothetical protein